MAKPGVTEYVQPGPAVPASELVELRYQLSPGVRAKLERRPVSAGSNSKTTFWNFQWYRDERLQPVRVRYAADLEASEKLARRFLSEPVLGFDMEWKPVYGKRTRPGSLKDQTSLIQLACDGEVGLFHIAQHVGETVDELFAPSLLKIIRSPFIAKAGVAIMNADARQLKNGAGLKARGLFELSYLNNLVEYAESDATKCNKGMVSLSKLAARHLGFPLAKGKVRTSNWTLPLDEAQRNYAASDAYVGFVLYHTMNAKRLKIVPLPPMPDFAEHFKPIRLGVGPGDDDDNKENVVPSSPSSTGKMASSVEQSASSIGSSGNSSNSSKIDTPRKPVRQAPKFRMPPGLEHLAFKDEDLLERNATKRTHVIEEPDSDTSPKIRKVVEVNEAPGTHSLQMALHDLRSQLAAASRSSAPTHVTDSTLSKIAVSQPATMSDLCRIPGGAPLLLYCKRNGVDLLAFIKEHGTRS